MSVESKPLGMKLFSAAMITGKTFTPKQSGMSKNFLFTGQQRKVRAALARSALAGQAQLEVKLCADMITHQMSLSGFFGSHNSESCLSVGQMTPSLQNGLPGMPWPYSIAHNRNSPASARRKMSSSSGLSLAVRTFGLAEGSGMI